MEQAMMDSTIYVISVRQIKSRAITSIIKANGKLYGGGLVKIPKFYPADMRLLQRFQHLTLEHVEERSFGTYEFR
jgi:hypothetical protein